MKSAGWPSFSFTEMLRPADGWKTDHAILTTYSADLPVIITALLALTGCDLEHRRTGSRVELVKAIEALSGRVCVLAQAGRVAIPNSPRPILKLLDRFLRAVETDEHERSWHPKVAMVRYCRVDDATDRQWRVWLGSRNLTKATNWEAGLMLASNADGSGNDIQGIAGLGAALASRATLGGMPSAEVAKELAALTWECPPGSAVKSVRLLGPGVIGGLPEPPTDTERALIVSPFLDAKTVRSVAAWGNGNTRRTLVSTAMELQRLWRESPSVFEGFDRVLIQPLPDLPAEGSALFDEEPLPAVEPADGEEAPPAGLHAKLLLAAKKGRRQLWLGSANATERGWNGRNHEVVAELSLGQDAADALEEFVTDCKRFVPSDLPPVCDEDEEAVEDVRKILCGRWPLVQRVEDTQVEVVAPAAPPIIDPAVRLEVAVLGGTWTSWPQGERSIVFSPLRAWLSGDGQSAPRRVEIERFKVHHFLDMKTALFWSAKTLWVGHGQCPQSEYSRNCTQPAFARVVAPADCQGAGREPTHSGPLCPGVGRKVHHFDPRLS